MSQENVLKLGSIQPIGANNVVVEAKYVKGGYVAVNTIAERDALKGNNGENIVEGSLCYVTGTPNKSEQGFYQYKEGRWQAANLGGGGSNIIIEETYDPTSKNAISGIGVADALKEFKEEYITPLEDILTHTSITLFFSMESGGKISFVNLTGTTCINWGDGETNTEFSHVYDQEGEYSVILYNTYILGPRCVTVLGNNTLTKVVVENKDIQIDTDAFAEHVSLSDIQILGPMVKIAPGAFFGCSGLREITIASENTNKDGNQYPLGYFFGIVEYPDSIKTEQTYRTSQNDIISNTYYIPTALEKVTVLRGEIVYGAFYNCSNLTHIVIGEQVLKIHEYAFYNCKKLLTVDFNAIACLDSIQAGHIFDYAGSVVGGVNIKIGARAHRVPGYLCQEELGPPTVKISSVTFEDGSTCSEIGLYAFSRGLKSTSIILPSSLSKIGEHAFYNCTSLTNVVIGDGVVSVGEYAFAQCSSLTSVVIPDSVTSIGDRAFRGCSSLTSVVIPDSVTSIGNYAFENCYNLASAAIGYSVTSIGISAFGNCSSLKDIYITDLGTWCQVQGANWLTTANSNEKNLYLNEERITHLVIPAEATRIQSFQSCSFTSLTIHGGVSYISTDAFANCNSLINVQILDGQYLSFGTSVFSGCKNLTTVKLGSGTQDLPPAIFYNCTSLQTITLPNTLQTISAAVFFCCESLIELTIPSSVTVIYSGVFHRKGNQPLTIYAKHSSKPEGWQDGWDNLRSDGSIVATVIYESTPLMATNWSLRPSEPDTEIFYGNVQVNNDIIVTYNDEQYSLTKILELLGGYFDEAKI